jgi:GT2 family glycosyltransferase
VTTSPTTSPEGETRPADAAAPLRPDVSVVIVSWKVRELLDKCLETLRTSTERARLEVLVIDNQSGDGTLEMVADKHPSVVGIDSGGNLGFSRGNNLGFARATGRTVLLLNPDTEVRPGAVDRLLETLERDPAIGIAGPKVLLPTGEIQHACARHFPNLWNQALQILGFAHRFPQNRWAGDFRMSSWDHQDARDVDAVSGCCLLIRADLLNELEGLDPSFFMYGEDLDLCWRVRKRGARIRYVPSAEILHISMQSSTQAPRRMLVHMHESMYRFFRKNRGAWAAFVYRMTFAAVSGAWLVAESLRARLVGGEKARALRESAIPRYQTIFDWATRRWRVDVNRG